eukprot:3544131-Pleurochrysis_carterae.AAC.1
MPLPAAMDARARSEVGRIVAQNVWSQSTPCVWAQLCTHNRAFRAPLRFLLYTQMSRTRERSRGSCERSMSVQLLLAAWLAISA